MDVDEIVPENTLKRKHEEKEVDWNSLPDEIWVNILKFLTSDHKTYLLLRFVSKRIRAIIEDGVLFSPPPITNDSLALWSSAPVPSFTGRSMKLLLQREKSYDPRRGPFKFQHYREFVKMQTLKINAPVQMRMSFTLPQKLICPNLRVLEISNMRIDSFDFLRDLENLRDLHIELVDVTNAFEIIRLPSRIERIVVKRQLIVLGNVRLPKSLKEFTYHSTSDPALPTPDFSQCSELELLDLEYLDVDFSNLNNCTSLQILSVKCTDRIANVGVLSDSLLLRHLTLSGKVITELIGIDRFNLETLFINVIGEVKPRVVGILQFKPTLTTFSCHNFDVDENCDFSLCDKLKYFSVRYCLANLNKISSAYESLKTLIIRGLTAVVNISCINKFEKLEHVDISAQNLELMVNTTIEDTGTIILFELPKTVKHLTLKPAGLFDISKCINSQFIELKYETYFSFCGPFENFSKLTELHIYSDETIPFSLKWMQFPMSLEVLYMSKVSTDCKLDCLALLPNLRELELYTTYGTKFTSQEYINLSRTVAKRKSLLSIVQK